VLPAHPSLIFYREDAGSGTSQKTCPFPCPQLSGTKAWELSGSVYALAILFLFSAAVFEMK